MPTPLRRRLRLARRGFGYTAAIVLVLVALLLGAASQVLPLAEQHPDRIAKWLSERAGRPVAFDSVETAWTRRGPLLQLDNLRIGEGAKAFTVGDTEMLVSVYAGLLPGRAFSELRLRGLDLTLERADDGRWQVRGLPGQQQSESDPFAALEGLGELQVIGGKLAVIAPQLGINARIPRIDLRLRVDGDRVRAGVRAWPRTDVAPANAMLDFDRRKGDGRAYAGAKRADLAAWSALLTLQGIAVESGTGRAEAWADLRDKRVAAITIGTELDNVSLRGTPIETGAPPPRSRFERVEGRVHYRLVQDGWRIDAPLLRIGREGEMQKLDGLLVAGGAQYAVQAQQVDAGPLFSALALSDRLSPGLRRWLLSSKPVASLHDIEIAGRRGGAMRAHAGIRDLGFASIGDAPGVSGLTGVVDGDSNGFTFRFDPQAEVAFDWPEGFGTVHHLKLRGEAGGWREGDGWRVGTAALRVDGRNIYGTFGALARGGLWWQGDGTRPWIDIAAEVDDNTEIPVAKSFWLRKDMPETAVRWLDMGLAGGKLRDGRAVITGDLDDWPFRDNTGLFEATGHISDATIQFDDEWPAAQGLEADVRFSGIGFDVDGTGRLGAVGIRRIHAAIDDYRGGALTVKAEGTGDAAQLLDVLKQSPLRKEHADTFANVRASGPATVGFALKLPLHGGGTTIDGTVALKNAKLADPRWKLAFDQVNGEAVYSRSGFKAEGLAVRHDGEPGRLSLRAGDEYVRDAGNVFEAGLDASLGAAELIDRAEDLDWLKPYLAGRSEWTIGVAIPKTKPGTSAPTLLQLRSGLVGTALSLPAPMRKSAATALATTIEAPLPLGSGDILVSFGEVMALRARSSKGQAGVRVALGAGRVDEAAPASGLVATGRAEALDAIDWIALTRGGQGDTKLPLQRIDVTTRQLHLLGGTFPDTRVVVVPAAQDAIAIQADGAALQGSLRVPASENEAIAGRMQRVFWRAASPSSASTPAVANAAAPAADELDPAKIPALTIDIDELRLGDAKLGTAKVRTRPSATGMHLEQLQTRSPQQRIDLSGDWTGTGASAKTHLKLEIGSDDFGALLAGFGMGNQLGGGAGTVKFDAGWPGSPVAFRLDQLEGSLQLDAKEGRLLEVEPGAGRVLGLLSIAQLPRRLTLDFSDFFYKGFAFNEMKGTVRFGNGQARSDKLLIDGPAASIDIRGVANLHAQSYDQTIEVRPKAGNLLTAIGAVAGGPVGAAIGAAANVVLSKPLGSMTAKTYRVTGPWKDPKVEVISREESRAEAPVVPPQG